MAWNPTTPITGAAQTGFTGPTYGLTSDSAPDNNGKQHAVTALGGTQVGVNSHSVASPFTITFWRPKILKVLGAANQATGLLMGSVARNTYKLITRKGVYPLAGQPAQVMVITTTIDVPAGADSYDAVNVRAALSAHSGGLYQNADGVGLTLITGVS